MEERHGCRPGVTWCQESVSDNLCKKSYKEAFDPSAPTAQISILIHWMFLDVVTSLSEYMNMRLGQHEMAHRYLRRCAITQKWVETPSATKPFWQSLRTPQRAKAAEARGREHLRELLRG